MKKLLALAMSLTLIFSLSACDVKTKEDAKGTEGTETESSAPVTTATAGEKPKVSLLAYTGVEKVANIVRDQLTKSGFDVTVNMQPDYSSYKTILDNGNYDISVNGWTTVTGNPDYAVRALYRSDGDSNSNKINDPKVDELIDLAASQTPDEYLATYTEFEKYVVDEKAYTVPIYQNIKTQGVNVEVLNPDTVRLSKSRSMVWEAISFNDESKNETEPMILSQTASNLKSLDPIRGNDGSINMLNTNMYIRVINLTDDDKVTSEGSLSYEHAIAEGNSEYYFVLRDDVTFAKVEDMKAVDTGIRVGAEDAVFSLNRAKDKNSVPVHATFSLHSSMDTIEIVSDLAELETVKDATGKSIKEVLEAKTPSAISSLTEDKTTVDNASGTYQVIKVKTTNPFPQVLNYLAHQSAGVVNKEQIETINEGITAENYDVQKDVLYGDQETITEGATYDNTLMASGPYIATLKNDYHVLFQKNPGYMAGTEFEPKITDYQVKFFKDLDGSLSALRSGETYVLYSVPEEKVDLVKGDSKFVIQEIPSNAINYLGFNREGIMASDNLRQAVKYSINQQEIQAVYMNRVFDAYTTLTPLLDTGNKLDADPAKVAEYLAAYAEENK